MSTHIVVLIAVFTLGIGIGVLLCLLVQTIRQCRREREQARRTFQFEVQALRRDLEAFRPEVDRMRSRYGSS